MAIISSICEPKNYANKNRFKKCSLSISASMLGPSSNSQEPYFNPGRANEKDISEQPSPWRKSSKRESCYGDRVYGQHLYRDLAFACPDSAHVFFRGWSSTVGNLKDNFRVTKYNSPCFFVLFWGSDLNQRSPTVSFQQYSTNRSFLEVRASSR